MTMKCYFGSGSPFAWRVLLALTVKGLAFEAIELQMSKGEHKEPDYLAINPHGEVPALVDGDFTIYESGAIIAYLESKYPQKPLLGKTPEETGLIWQRVFEVQNHFLPVLRSGVRPLFTGEFEAQKEAVQAALDKVPAEFATLEGWLGDNDYLTGDAISAVDITVYPAVALLQRVLSSPAAAAANVSAIVPLSNSAPKLIAWMQRIEGIPGFDAVYPPHWKEAA